MNDFKIKFLSKKAYMPRRATKGSVGYDLYVPQDTEIIIGRQVVPLDISIEMPCNVEAKIEPRSGFSSKGMEGCCFHRAADKLFVSTTPERFDADVLVGKIDWDYRGNIGVIINSRERFIIKAGTRIAQLTFYPVITEELELTVDLSETERGEGGFESTGTK
jgi:dUTP pyrophosphatase